MNINLFLLLLVFAKLSLQAQKVKSKRFITLVPTEAKFNFDEVKTASWEVNFVNNTKISNPGIDSLYVSSFFKNSGIRLASKSDLRFVIDIYVNPSEFFIDKNELSKYDLFITSRTSAILKIYRYEHLILSKHVMLPDASSKDISQKNDIKRNYHLYKVEGADFTNTNLFATSASAAFPKYLVRNRKDLRRVSKYEEAKILKRQTEKLIKNGFKYFGDYYLTNKNFEYLKWFYIKDKSSKYSALSTLLDAYKETKNKNIHAKFKESSYLSDVKKIKGAYLEYLENTNDLDQKTEGYVHINLMNCAFALNEYGEAQDHYNKALVTKEAYLEKTPDRLLKTTRYTTAEKAAFKEEIDTYTKLNQFEVASPTYFDKYDIFSLIYLIEYRMAMFKNTKDFPCANILLEELYYAINTFLSIKINDLPFFKLATKEELVRFKEAIVDQYEGSSLDHTLFNQVRFLVVGDYTDRALKAEYAEYHDVLKRMLRMNYTYALINQLPADCATVYAEDYEKSLKYYNEVAAKVDPLVNAAPQEISKVFELANHTQLHFTAIADKHMANAFGKELKFK